LMFRMTVGSVHVGTPTVNETPAIPTSYILDTPGAIPYTLAQEQKR
jgi:hypothetical protein